MLFFSILRRLFSEKVGFFLLIILLLVSVVAISSLCVNHFILKKLINSKITQKFLVWDFWKFLNHNLKLEELFPPEKFWFLKFTENFINFWNFLHLLVNERKFIDLFSKNLFLANPYNNPEIQILILNLLLIIIVVFEFFKKMKISIYSLIHKFSKECNND